jgi:hypothetical protein
MFDLLKKKYRKQNVYTVNMLASLLSMVDNVHFFPVTHDTFWDIDKMLNVFYKVSPADCFCVCVCVCVLQF